MKTIYDNSDSYDETPLWESMSVKGNDRKNLSTDEKKAKDKMRRSASTEAAFTKSASTEAMVLKQDPSSSKAYSTPGYYVVTKDGAPQDGPYESYSLAIANLKGRDAIEFLDQSKVAPLNEPWPLGMNTVVGNLNQEKGSSMAPFQVREAQLLSAMALATAEEQAHLMADLEHLRKTERLRIQSSRELDIADEYIHDTLTPVLPYVRHTASTDWLAGVEVDVDKVQTHMLTQAALWYNKLDPAIRVNRSEYLAQAHGLASKEASAFGEYRPLAYKTFMDHIAMINRFSNAEGLLPWSEVEPPLPASMPLGDNYNTNQIGTPGQVGQPQPLSNDAENAFLFEPDSPSTPEGMGQAGQVNEWMPNADMAPPGAAGTTGGSDSAINRTSAKEDSPHPYDNGDSIGGGWGRHDVPCKTCGGDADDPQHMFYGPSKTSALEDEEVSQGNADPQSDTPWDGWNGMHILPPVTTLDTPESLAQASSPNNANVNPFMDMGDQPNPAHYAAKNNELKKHLNAQHGLSASIEGKDDHFLEWQHKHDHQLMSNGFVPTGASNHDENSRWYSGHSVNQTMGSAAFNYERPTYQQYLNRLSEGAAPVSEEFYAGSLAAVSPRADQASWDGGYTASIHTAVKCSKCGSNNVTLSSTPLSETRSRGNMVDCKDCGYHDYTPKKTADFKDPSGSQIGNNPAAQYNPQQAWEQSGNAQSGLPIAPTHMGENFSNITDWPDTGPAEVPGNRAPNIVENAGPDKDTDEDDDTLGMDRMSSIHTATGKYDSMEPRARGQRLISEGEARGRSEVGAGNNTTVRRHVDEDGLHGFKVRLHGTDIVTHHGNGDVTLNSGGYHSHTTTSRMNEWLPSGLQVNRKGGIIHVTRGGDPSTAQPLTDGDRFKTHHSDYLKDMTAALRRRAKQDKEDGFETGGRGEGGYNPDKGLKAQSPQGQADADSEFEKEQSSGKMIDWSDTGENVLGTVPVQGYEYNAEHPNAEMWPWQIGPVGIGPSGAADMANTPIPGAAYGGYPQPDIKRNAKLDSFVDSIHF